MSFVNVFSLVVVILALLWILRGFYRVYFHPLSEFPGPKVSAFSRIPYIIAIFKGELPKYIACIHDTYGEVVRISPDELSFAHPEIWREMFSYKVKDGKEPPTKDWGRRPQPVNGVHSLITLSNNVQHARTRKIFLPAFSDRALTQQAPLFNRYADMLVECLKAGEKFDMVRMYNFTTFDIMGDLTFGESLHMLDNATYDPWVKTIFASIKAASISNVVFFYYPLIGKIIKRLFRKKFTEASLTHFNHSVTRVTKRLQKGRDTGVDIWDLVLQSQEKDKMTLSRDEMDSNASMFMIAGTETTATMLSGVTYLLLANRDKLELLVREIRGAFQSSDSITMEILQGLPYLNACLKESLRRYPPAPIGLPLRTPKSGSIICGHYVPPNSVVTANHLAIYESPSLWTDPTKFVPERWLGDTKYTNDVRSAMQPFNYGPRDCLGKNMAWHEMRLLLAKVLYNFDLSLCPESEGWIERQKVYQFWEKPPLLAQVRERVA